MGLPLGRKLLEVEDEAMRENVEIAEIRPWEYPPLGVREGKRPHGEGEQV